MTREEQKQARRQEIIEKSLDLFISKGYAQTKISDIAEAVDMSVGLLFHYFKSKEALYEELIDLGVHGPKSVMELQTSGSLAFFTAVSGAIFSHHNKQPFAAKIFVLMGQANHNTALPQNIKDKLAQIDNIEESVKIVKQGQEKGEIREGDALALSISFWSAIQGIMETLALHPEYPTPSAEWVVDILRRKK